MADDAAQLLISDDRDPNLLYVTGITAPDPLIYLRDRRGSVMVVRPLEVDRMRAQARVDEVVSRDELGYRSYLDELGSEWAALGEVAASLVKSRGNGSVLVEPELPVACADQLRGRGLSVRVDPLMFTAQRRIKTYDEIEQIRHSQGAAQRALTSVAKLLCSGEIKDGVVWNEGRAVTAQALHRMAELLLAEAGFDPYDPIIAGPPLSGQPHNRGEGPIRAHGPIVLDFFPRDRESRYFGDVTRTICIGKPPASVLDMHAAVLEAQETALSIIKAGVSVKEVHLVICRTFQRRGYGSETPGFEDGVKAAKYTHNSGHGIGLAIHEHPSLGLFEDVLQVGDVITVEPGLYDPAIGGVRIEDTVVVTAGGIENLTWLPKGLYETACAFD